MAGAHEIGKRVLIHHTPGGLAGGSIACGCGWQAEVGPYESLTVAHAALGAEWADHVDETDTTTP